MTTPFSDSRAERPRCKRPLDRAIARVSILPEAPATPR